MKVSVVWISVVLVASAVVSLGAEMQSASQKKNKRQFSITIEVPPRIRAGETIPATVTLTNIGNEQIGFMNGIFGYVVDVRSAGKGGQETDKGRESNRLQGHAVSGVTRVKRLSPGEKWVTTFSVNDWFDMSQAGDYTIQLKRENVQSNVVTVTVTE